MFVCGVRGEAASAPALHDMERNKRIALYKQISIYLERLLATYKLNQTV